MSFDLPPKLNNFHWTVCSIWEWWIASDLFFLLRNVNIISKLFSSFAIPFIADQNFPNFPKSSFMLQSRFSLWTFRFWRSLVISLHLARRWEWVRLSLPDSMLDSWKAFELLRRKALYRFKQWRHVLLPSRRAGQQGSFGVGTLSSCSHVLPPFQCYSASTDTCLCSTRSQLAQHLLHSSISHGFAFCHFFPPIVFRFSAQMQHCSQLSSLNVNCLWKAWNVEKFVHFCHFFENQSCYSKKSSLEVNPLLFFHENSLTQFKKSALQKWVRVLPRLKRTRNKLFAKLARVLVRNFGEILVQLKEQTTESKMFNKFVRSPKLCNFYDRSKLPQFRIAGFENLTNQSRSILSLWNISECLGMFIERQSFFGRKAKVQIIEAWKKKEEICFFDQLSC